MPAFGYDRDAPCYEEASTGRHLPGNIDELPPTSITLVTHNGSECFSFTDDEAGWIKARRMLRTKAASSTDPNGWRIDRYVHWDAGDMGDLVRMYHVCFARPPSDLPSLSLAKRQARS